jgi:hypothetical protein
MAMGIRKVGDDSDNVFSTAWYKDEVVKAERGNREHIAKYDRSFNAIMAKAVADGDEKDNKMTEIAKAHRDRGAGPHGLTGALLEHLHDRLERRREQHGYQKREEGPLDQHQELISIMKDSGGPVSVCKAIVDRGRSPCGEHELVAALTKAASEQHPQLSPAQAFAELYKTEAVWRAIGIAKSMPFQVSLEPLMVGGEANRGGDVNPNDPSEAIAQLKQLGARKWPTASEAQQFANAFTDPANATLAAKAHRRPSPTTSYEFPR